MTNVGDQSKWRLEDLVDYGDSDSEEGDSKNTYADSTSCRTAEEELDTDHDEMRTRRCTSEATSIPKLHESSVLSQNPVLKQELNDMDTFHTRMKLEEGTIDLTLTVSPTKIETSRHERHTVECDAEEQRGSSSAIATMRSLQSSQHPNRNSDTLVSRNRHASTRAQTAQRRCLYINTRSGCRWGSRCAFSHEDDRHSSWRPQFSGALPLPVFRDTQKWHPNSQKSASYQSGHDKNYLGRRHIPTGHGHGTTRVSKTGRYRINNER
jgi:hypothetical protein